MNEIRSVCMLSNIMRIRYVTSAGITLLVLLVALSFIGISDTRVTLCHCKKNKNKVCDSVCRTTRKGRNGQFESDKCIPGQSFMRGCNECFCDEGNAVCTFLGCNELDSTPVIPCKPGATVIKSDNCNTCLCGKNGKIRSCTKRKSCVGARPWIAYGKTASKCRHGQRFLLNDGCNTCECDIDGRLHDCTQNMCSKSEEVKSNDKTKEKSKPSAKTATKTDTTTTQGAKRITMMPHEGVDMYWEYML